MRSEIYYSSGKDEIVVLWRSKKLPHIINCQYIIFEFSPHGGESFFPFYFKVIMKQPVLFLMQLGFEFVGYVD